MQKITTILVSDHEGTPLGHIEILAAPDGYAVKPTEFDESAPAVETTGWAPSLVKAFDLAFTFAHAWLAFPPKG